MIDYDAVIFVAVKLEEKSQIKWIKKNISININK